jgi:SAM-dependent methyltransferase/energy-converting hydrogenase Eha subunit B
MTKVRGARLDLFLISLLTLFLELACIRWFPSHVLFLTFFTNTVLLACILGISVGCLAAKRRQNFLPWTPFMLIVGLASAHFVDLLRRLSNSVIDVGNQASPQMVFFGVEYQSQDLSSFVIPIEALCGYFFLVIALTMVGPGQQLGRALARLPNRLEAYTVNILGSIAGIVLFAACSLLEWSPLWWFASVMAGLTYFLMREDRIRGLALTLAPALVLILSANATFSPLGGPRELWSPYYRIHYEPDPKLITVNLIGHQQMQSRQSPFPAYALPHLLNRDAGQKPFGQVLIIGAGSGNDVSRALAWGAERVDAVEIDPVIQRLGQQDHPDRPYDDPRVFVHLNDGRNYLKSSNKQYDLIVYALVDSLVLHSSYSNIRLESYLFTKQAMDDVRKRLKPNGVFVMYNYFRQGWIVSRLQNAVRSSFGSDALVLNLPSRDTLDPDQTLGGDFTMLIAGASGPIREAFTREPEYWLRIGRVLDGRTLNGFAYPLPDERAGWRAMPVAEREKSEWQQFRLTKVNAGRETARLATDDWPMLYLREPMIPGLSLRGAAIMAVIALLLLAPFFGRAAAAAPASVDSAGALVQMFFLGAGFMLVETKAVVHMALLFGGTWIVNSVVIFAVLVMILVANLFVFIAKPSKLVPYYAGLFISLTVSALVPMEYFLGMDRTAQIAGASVLAFVPILFAGVIFAVSFSRVAEPDRAFGANIAGAMFGGLAEYSSMLLGFQYLLFVAVALYACSLVGMRRNKVRNRPSTGLGAG